MRVEIRHRNEGTWRRKHFIDLDVFFSEEERRIITIRGLQHIEIDLTPGILASSEFPLPPPLIPFMFFGSPLLFLGGCVSATIHSTVNGSTGLGALFMIAAVGLFAYAIYARLRLSRANITTISINSFFETAHRPVLVPSADAAVATAILRRRFAALKQIIEDSGQLSVEVLEL